MLEEANEGGVGLPGSNKTKGTKVRGFRSLPWHVGADGLLPGSLRNSHQSGRYCDQGLAALEGAEGGVSTAKLRISGGDHSLTRSTF